MKWIRRRVGWIAGAAIGGFLLWLVGTVVSLRVTQAEAAGLLFGRKVPLSTYHQALEAAGHWAVLTYGDKARKEVPEEELARQAWERLILLTEAKRLKVRVSDKEVVEEIRRQSLFQRDGQFDRAGYQVIIQYSLGTTPRIFEEEFREQMTIKKLLRQVIPDPVVTEEELHKHFLQRETPIRVSTLTLSSEPLAREIAQAARQRPDQLSHAARQLGLKVISSDFFKADALLPDIGRAGIIFEPLFTMEPGQVTGPLISPKGWIVAKLEAKQPPDEKKFGELKDGLRKELTARKRMESTFAWYQNLLKRANLKETK